MSLRVLIDDNIIIDCMVRREPWVKTSEAVLTMCVEDKCEGFVTADGITNIYYSLRKMWPPRERRRKMKDMLKIVCLTDTTREDCLWALESPVRDFEDAVQVEVAQRIGAEVIVTRNAKDFRTVTGMKVMVPEDFVREYNK